MYKWQRKKNKQKKTCRNPPPTEYVQDVCIDDNVPQV